MKDRKKQFFLITLHLLFWLFVCVAFCVLSFLRPMAMHDWKEILSALMVAGMVYANYLLLIPKLLLQGKRKQFWTCAIVLVAVSVAIEMLLTYSDMHIRCSFLDSEQLKIQYYTSIFLLLLRNFSFFLFFLVLRLYRANALVLENVEKVITQEVYKLIVISPKDKLQLVDFKDIAYFSCDNNGIVLTMKNEKQIQCNGTLLELEYLIPPEYWIRANRQTLVMRDSIVRYNTSALCINVNGQEQIISYFSTKPEEVLENLKRWNPDLYTSEDFGEEVRLPDELHQLQEYLEQNPDANLQQISEALHISNRTTQRRMAELRKLNLI